MTFFAPFCVPFMVGAAVMLLALAAKYAWWFYGLPRADKLRFVRGLPTRRTLEAVGEVIGESLLHRRIFRVNPLLGYMHMSLAFGWFLLIVAGWVETAAYLGLRYVPLQGHVFFRYFSTGMEHKPVFDFIMDLLLLLVLSGVVLAWGKRVWSRAMGMRRTTRHVMGDRIALSALWFIFPLRLAAESLTCALYGGGGFLTGTIGSLLAGHADAQVLRALFLPAWWGYSLALGIFFVALPFSRYMHIFTEIPLIFLRRYGIRSSGMGRVGYFAGCMTLLTPRTLRAMERIFAAAGEQVWWADRDGGVCCGRPLKLSGETDSARKMADYNTALFRRHGITTLVTSCPICLKVFREEYRLEGIEVLHHSQYILRLLREGRLAVEGSGERYTYHDPCELGRGSGVYDEPRAVVAALGELLEPEQTREHALCCGSSVANTAISDAQQLELARSVTGCLEATGATAIVTACPLCKKALGRGASLPVADLSEVVAAHIRAGHTFSDNS